VGAGYWAAVEEALTAALAMKDTERRQFLAGLADARVSSEVNSLLSAGGGSDSGFLSAIATAGESWRATGFRVPGRFHIIREVGQGGMGAVFEAFDQDRNLRVALKSLTRISATHLFCFKQEFRSLANLVHPNVVKLYELIQEDRNYFLSMEFIDGITSLASYARFFDRLPSAFRQYTQPANFTWI
jgi:serine/threonine protein kinase